jgi:hypothetical protein
MISPLRMHLYVSAHRACVDADAVSWWCPTVDALSALDRVVAASCDGEDDGIDTVSAMLRKKRKGAHVLSRSHRLVRIFDTATFCVRGGLDRLIFFSPLDLVLCHRSSRLLSPHVPVPKPMIERQGLQWPAVP